MRNLLIVFAVLLLALAGYAYYHPAVYEKFLGDAGSSLSPHPAAPIAPLIEGKLISADGNPFPFPANAPIASLHYYAIYYSAQWCPPCHAFTPVLVQWYRKFKPSHPDFELIFVSDDHDKASMFAYMKEMAMPWPAFPFDELKHDGAGIEKFAGSGIPDLVLVDAGGKVFSDSYQDGRYVGPETVIDAINKLLGGGSPIPLARQMPSAPASSPVFISAQN
jgi:nucleoredoxin